MHSTADSKDPDIHILDEWMPSNRNTPSMHHPWRQNSDYLDGWIKKLITYAKISPKMVNPRDLAGNAGEEEEEDGVCCVYFRCLEESAPSWNWYTANCARTRIAAAGRCMTGQMRQTRWFYFCSRLWLTVARWAFLGLALSALQSVGSVLIIIIIIIIIIMIIALKGETWGFFFFFFFFLQSPHCNVNCLQKVHSNGLGANMCKSHATLTHRKLITCNMQCATWYEGTAIKFDRL